jgi:hypothetical protein
MVIARRTILVLLVLAFALSVAYVTAVVLWLKDADLKKLAYYALYPYQGPQETGPLLIPLEDRIATYLLDGKNPRDVLREATETGVQLELVFGARSRDPKLREVANLRAAQVADLFIAKGMDVNQRDHYGCTAAQRAMLNGDRYALCYLLARGAHGEGFARARIRQCRSSLDELSRQIGAEGACDLCQRVQRPKPAAKTGA